MAQKVSAPDTSTSWPPGWLKEDRFWGLVLLLMVVLVYSPVGWAGYIWDDDLVLTENPVIVGPLGLKEIWTTDAADICPLTITTFWVEHALWGLAPLPYHLVNVCLHGATALVLWQLLRKLRIPGAWLGAALWAVHPVMVESVAWITEMKNTESGLFYLLAILFFTRHLQAAQTADSRETNWNYGLMLLFAAMAIASKSSTVILPLVLCLCAWWTEGRWQWRNLRKVAPIFLMSVAAGLLSIWKQKLEGAYGPDMARSWPERLATAGDAVWFYLGKLAWPHPLLMVYPPWKIDTSDGISYLPLVAVVSVFVVLWLKRESWGRPCFFAFAYFLVALLPVVGFLNIKYFIYSQVADHFQYLAAMGPLSLAGAGMVRLAEFATPQRNWLEATLGAGLLLLLGSVSWQKAWVYQNETTLWADTLPLNPECFVGYNNLGMVAVRAGKMDEALPLFEKTLQINPRYDTAENNMGSTLLQKGDVDGAISHYEKALVLRPDVARVHVNLGLALERKGRLDEAVAHFQKALELDPTDVEAGSGLGLAYIQKKQLDAAFACFKKTVEFHPEDARAHTNYGSALYQKNRVEESILEFKEALRLKPGDTDATNNLATAEATLKRNAAANVAP